jgi:hypothetical protein
MKHQNQMSGRQPIHSIGVPLARGASLMPIADLIVSLHPRIRQ